MNKEELENITNKEGDFKIWKSSGLWCLILRMPWSKHLDGYVGIPKSHRAYGKDYFTTSESEEGISKLEQAINDIDVHGGLTFSNKMRGFEIEDCWFFGFDCSHSGDLSMSSMSRIDIPSVAETSTYRDMKYVTNEVNKLAEQLEAIK